MSKPKRKPTTALYTLPDGHDWQEVWCDLTGMYRWECARTGATYTVTFEPDGTIEHDYEPGDEYVET